MKVFDRSPRQAATAHHGGKQFGFVGEASHEDDPDDYPDDVVDGDHDEIN